MKKTICGFLIIITICSLFVSCGNQKAETLNSNLALVEESSSVFAMKDLPTGELSWEDYDFPFPKPPADSFEIDRQYANPLKCRGITSAKLNVYFSQLSSDGWNEISNESPYHFIFLKGNEYLSISLEGAEGSITYVFGYDAGYIEDVQDRAISNTEALDYIRTAYNEYQSDQSISVRDTEITTIREIGIKDLFEKTDMQLFQAFGKHGEIAYFLVIEKTACILPCGASVVNHIPIFVADVDKDGEFEVITSYNAGSGISRFGVSAYKFGNPPEFDSLNKTIYKAYSNMWMEGELSLMLKESKNGEVYLFGFAYDGNDYALGEDYGRLTVDGNKLIPEDSIRFEKDF